MYRWVQRFNSEVIEAARLCRHAPGDRWRHLRLVLAEYEAHYNGRRPHRNRQLRPPQPDHPVADLCQKRIKRRPVLGGLINEYERAA